MASDNLPNCSKCGALGQRRQSDGEWLCIRHHKEKEKIKDEE